MPVTVEQVTRAYEEEKRSARPPLTIDDLPFSYEAITPEWLTAVLCGSHPGARAVSYRLDEPDNGTSNRRRLDIEYNDIGTQAGLPRRVFCKSSQALSNRISLGLSGALQAEVNFYNQIRESMPIEAPVSYFANYNEAFNSIVMLREFDEGTISCTYTTDITRQRAENQMRLLAAFHGKFLDSPQLKTTLSIFPTWSDFFVSLVGNYWEPLCDEALDLTADIIPARLMKRRKEIWPATMASAERHRHLPHTLTHGDVHIRNWYITPTGAMGLHDWQAVNRGHWSRDVIYTIVTALTPENRRQWDRELLHYYHDCLQQAAGRSIPFGDAWDEARRQLMTVLAYWTITLNPGPGIPELQPRDTVLEFIRRIAIAIDDLDALDSFK